MQVREVRAREGFGLMAARLSVTGELGYELFAPREHHAALYRALMAAGAPHGLRQLGGYALDSLRVEKGFGAWGKEFRTELTPAAAGLLRFVARNKPAAFVGKERLDTESSEALVTL